MTYNFADEQRNLLDEKLNNSNQIIGAAVGTLLDIATGPRFLISAEDQAKSCLETIKKIDPEGFKRLRESSEQIRNLTYDKNKKGDAQ